MAFAVPTDQAQLQAFIARRHPDYVAKVATWIFNELAYEGGDPFVKANVDRYVKESDREYLARVERAYTFPHAREVVDLIAKYIFKSEVERNVEGASPAVKAFWQRSTLSDLTIDQLMRLVCNGSSTTGRTWVFVDSTKTPEVLTVADAKAADARTYAYIVRPQDVLDLAYGSDGELAWIKVRETTRDDADPFASSGRVTLRYRLWTRDAWFAFRVERRGAKRGESDRSPTVDDQVQVQYAASVVAMAARNVANGVAQPTNGPEKFKLDPNAEVVLEDAGVNEIGRVPCFPVDHVIGDAKYSAPGLIDSIAKLEKKIMNYLSNLDAIIQDQSFSTLVMPAQGMLPGEDAYDKMIEMGTKRIFVYNGDGVTVGPNYISPDVKQAELIISAINKIINEIYHTIGMGGERTKQDNAVGIDNSSGVAKAYDFERLNSLLTSKSDSLENAEGRLVELVEAYAGNLDYRYDRSKPLVRYADTFDTRSLYDVFAEAERLMLLGAPESIRREQMRAVFKTLFPTAPDDLKARFEKDLADWPPPPPVVAVTATEDGNGPESKFPASGQAKPGQPAPAAGAPKPQGNAPKSKNAGTASRQGQVTSESK